MDKKALYYYLELSQPYLQVHNPGLHFHCGLDPRKNFNSYSRLDLTKLARPGVAVSLLWGSSWAGWSPEVHFDHCVPRCLPWYTRTKRGRCLKPSGEAWRHLAISPHTSGASEIEEELKAQDPLGVVWLLISEEGDERSKQTLLRKKNPIICMLYSAPILSSAFSNLEASHHSFYPHLHLGQALPPGSRLYFYGSPQCMFPIHFSCLPPNEDARPLPILKITLFSHFTAHSKHL